MLGRSRQDGTAQKELRHDNAEAVTKVSRGEGQEETSGQSSECDDLVKPHSR
jgi:hypothetical protein